MNKPTLVIDVSYIAHRAWYSMGALNHGSEGTGAIFGLLREVVALIEKTGAGCCVFAFDHPAPKHRETLCPTYKTTRKKKYAEENEVDKQNRKDFHRQLRLLYRKYLPEVGFKNVFAAAGFEADDIIAQVARGLDDAIIVSADGDLWQCLAPNVTIYNPQKGEFLTTRGFVDAWGIEPPTWAKVKAIAGCGTDDVPGVAGVGEKTAVRYLKGELPEHHKTYKAIKEASKSGFLKKNLQTVKLPMRGTPKFTVTPDEVTETAWRQLAEDLAMNTLKATLPAYATRCRRERKPKKRGGFDLGQ